MSRYTPVEHVVDPSCQAPTGRHGFYRAHRYDHCTCPGPSRDRFEQSVEGIRQREQQRKARLIKPVLRAVQPPKGTGRWPDVREAVDLEKQLWARNDLACATADPDLFDVIGSGPTARAQVREAAAICETCPALVLCRQVGLSVDRPETFMGGLTYAERCDMRRREQVAA